LKRIGFLIISTLLVLGLVVPGMVGGANPKIEILIAGPMTYTQGGDMYNGAELAANQINTAGGVDVGGTDYDIELVKVDTNEIDNYADAGTVLLGAITANPNAQFIIGGFRTEGVVNEIPVAMANNVTMFITGAASYELLAEAPLYPYIPAYAGYKYIFRGSPFNTVFLLGNSLMMLGMVAVEVASLGVTPRIAIFAESLTWADPIVEGAEALIPAMGWELGHVARVSDKASSTVVDPELNAIEADKCNIIWTVMSGDVGTVFSLRKGALDIPAIAVGINVEAQAASFWGDTNGGCEYEITMGTWAPGVEVTSTTLPFLSAFETAYGHFPMYTAAAYDVLNVLATAMNEVGSVNNEDLISWYEDPANAQNTTMGLVGNYPVWQYGSFGYWSMLADKDAPDNDVGFGVGILPALNSTQITQIYGDASNYDMPAGTNFTMPPYTTHDIIYGPTYVTGLAIQWQEAP